MPLSPVQAWQLPGPLQFLVTDSQKNPGTTWKNMGESAGGFFSITRPLVSDSTKNKGIGP